jgi:hypothetical protein
VRAGRTVAVWSVIGGFLWVTGRKPTKDFSGTLDAAGGMTDVIIASLFFASGLLLIAAGRISEIGKLGVISRRSLNLMKIGIVAFFAGLLQLFLGNAEVIEILGGTPLEHYRLGNALFLGFLICLPAGLVLIGLGCALDSANARARLGGVMSIAAVAAGIGATAYAVRFPSDDDPFALFEYFFLAGLCCLVGLLIAYFGLKRAGLARLQQAEAVPEP